MKRSVVLGAVCLAAACGGGKSETVVAARPMSGSGVSAGDCVEARRRAAADPDLPVDRLPGVTAQTPQPFQRMPANVRSLVNRSGASVRTEVLIDTLGRPVMSTFRVVESKPHAWMGQNIRAITPRWKFTPAELAGCRVPRVYKFSATAPRRG